MDFDEMLESCRSVTAIHMKNIHSDLNIAYCPSMSREAVVEVLNNLLTVTSTKTLTMGPMLLAKLTDEDKAIATSKGWALK